MSKEHSQGGDSTITSNDAAQALPIGSLLGERYRIEALLGIGGMGMVYRATDLSLGVPVALKLLRPELSARAEAFERFRQEVLLARQVSHPHVLRIHDIARDGGRWFISMDLVEGESLDRLLARDGGLPIERCVEIGMQIAQGLAAAHKQGVVHRDLKPSNVLIDGQGQARIADFGVARSLGGSGLTQAGAVVGTPDYLSPEQARGLPVDARSDLYALGLLLFEMLTGRLPFSAQTAAESFSQRVGGYHIPLRRLRRDAPVWLDRLLARLLRPQPSQRLPSAERVVEVLQQQRLAADWRPWLPRAAVAILMLGLLGGLGWWVGRAGPSTPALAAIDRLLLVPIELEGDGLTADALRALTEQLRRALEHGSDLAWVDAERAGHGIERLGIPRSAEARSALLTDLRASRLLQIQLRPQGDVWQAEAQLFNAEGQPTPLRASASGSDPSAAALALLPSLRSQLQTAPLNSPLDRAVAEPSLQAQGQGLEQRLRGRIGAAISAFDAALQADPNNVAAALDLAESGQLAGDAGVVERALRALERLLPATAANPTAVLRAEFDDQRERRTVLWQQRLRANPDAINAYWALAEAQAADGELAAAEATLDAGLQRDPGDPRGWFLRGKIAILRGEARPAVDDFLVRAVLLNKRDRNRFGEAEAVNALGVGYARLGQMVDAEEQYQRALELREVIGHPRGVASSLRNLAQVAMIQGRRDEAAQRLARARELFEQLGDRSGLAAVDNELGLLAEERGDFGAALEAYRQALRSRESLGDRLGVAESLNNLGFAHYLHGDYDSAQVFWRQALEAFQSLGDRAGEVRSEQNLGLLDIVRGRWDQAAQRLNHSLQRASDQQLAEEMAVSRRNLAELALYRGEVSVALAHLQVAGQLFEERGDQRGSIDVGLLRTRAALVAEQTLAAKQELDALESQLDAASPEQQALAALNRHALAELEQDASAARRALQQARDAAQRSGIRALLLAVRSVEDPLQAGLRDEVQAFGHRPLWLGWLQRALQARARAAKPVDPDVATLYTLAQTSLTEQPQYALAWRLHQLAAAALEDADAARSAAQHAHDSLERLRAGLPEDWQSPMQARLTEFAEAELDE